jgi:hypothetical protein
MSRRSKSDPQCGDCSAVCGGGLSGLRGRLAFPDRYDHVAAVDHVSWRGAGEANIKRAEFANQFVIAVEAKRAIYVFTQPKHPAHPAVIVRVVVENGGGSIFKRMGHLWSFDL